MTEQEQRIAIAEFCGWENIKQIGTFTSPTITVGDVPGLVQEIAKELPDYPNSLDAMREAEKVVNREFYVAQLLAVIHEVDRDYFSKISWENGYELTTATAAQRAEALLRCIGQWKD